MSKRPELLMGERKENETDRAVQACNDYLRMGPRRSLRKLVNKPGKTRQNLATESVNTLEEWSASFGWSERASAYDADSEAAKNEKRRRVMEQGLALDYERITKLKRLARFLEDQIYTQHSDADSTDTGDGVTSTEYPHVWVRDFKQIGAGESAERVEIARFNAALLSEYRAALADIAAEAGGRRQKVDHMVANIDLSKLSDAQLERIANGEDIAQVIISGYANSS